MKLFFLTTVENKIINLTIIASDEREARDFVQANPNLSAGYDKDLWTNPDKSICEEISFDKTKIVMVSFDKDLFKMKNGMRPIHPGEILKEEFLIAVDVNDEETIRDIAKEIGINFEDLKNILEENQSITKEIAYLLGGYFDTSPEFWMNMQSSYDERKKNYQSEIDEKDNLLRDKIYECLVKYDVCCDLNGDEKSNNKNDFIEEIFNIITDHGIYANRHTTIEAVRSMYHLFNGGNIDTQSSKSRYYMIANCFVMLSKCGS